MIVKVNAFDFGYILSNILPILWRRKGVLFASVLAASLAAFAFYSVTGARFEAYTMLRVGQGIKERTGGNNPLGDGIDLTSRMDSIAKIAVTDHVVRLATIQVGPDRLFDETYATFLSRFRQAISEYIFQKSSPEATEAEGLTQSVLGGLRGAISARQEGRSDILKLSFRHPNQSAVADFANELSFALVAVQGDLVQVPGADVFFQQQAKRLEEQAEKAAADLQKFSIEASIYSVADQRILLLKRVSDVSALIATTRGNIEDRKGQRQAIVDQLMVMRPVAQSKTVTGIVGRLGGRDDKDNRDKSSSSVNAVGNVPGFEEQPPLLLVRVYQDAMASLLKINSELNGSLQLEKLLEDELRQVNSQLADLSSKEAEYDRLKRVLTRASNAADQYGTRMIEEQTSVDIAKRAQLSSVRVIQSAEKPIAPLFPRISHLVVLALFGGLAAGAAIAITLEMAKLQQKERLEEGRDNTLTQFARATRRGGSGVQAAQ
jgi:succinoglycan biosynthesis transport protein ExoP